MKLLKRSLIVLFLLGIFISAPRAQDAKPSQNPPQETNVTFLLVNDIYEMAEKKGPDGKPRGGFARVAAVAKAERAKGGHVVFAHGGDTLSPSLLNIAASGDGLR